MAGGREPSRREAHARLTRADVIAAAHRLFVERGYAATSIRRVAGEAGVSEQTVYRVFGDKAALLRAVILSAVGVDDSAPSLRESPLVEALATASSPHERLAIFAQVAREVYGRDLAQLEAVVTSAASADRRVAELARYIAEQRYEDTRSLVAAIVGDATLDGIELDDVVDYVYAVESSPVYMTLTAERGWTTERYVEWFVEMFERTVLSRIGDPSGGPKRRRPKGQGATRP